jgi:hypothetical protein
MPLLQLVLKVLMVLVVLLGHKVLMVLVVLVVLVLVLPRLFYVPTKVLRKEEVRGVQMASEPGAPELRNGELHSCSGTWTILLVVTALQSRSMLHHGSLARVYTTALSQECTPRLSHKSVHHGSLARVYEQNPTSRTYCFEPPFRSYCFEPPFPFPCSTSARASVNAASARILDRKSTSRAHAPSSALFMPAFPRGLKCKVPTK